MKEVRGRERGGEREEVGEEKGEGGEEKDGGGEVEENRDDVGRSHDLVSYHQYTWPDVVTTVVMKLDTDTFTIGSFVNSAYSRAS